MDCTGIGSGPGLSGPPHAAVHAERSWREGLPVRPAERTVSREVAASIFCTVYGAVSASSVVSQTDPVQAPAAPRAIAAAIWRPVTMPPAASTGTGRIGAMA